MLSTGSVLPIWSVEATHPAKPLKLIGRGPQVAARVASTVGRYRADDAAAEAHAKLVEARREPVDDPVNV